MLHIPHSERTGNRCYTSELTKTASVLHCHADVRDEEADKFPLEAAVRRAAVRSRGTRVVAD